MSEWRIEHRPIAMQVRDLLYNMLIEKHFLPGDRLPSELELADRFGVSRGALREALKLMEEERVILCQHGVGRFVAPKIEGLYSEDITRLKSVSELSISLGTTLTCKVLSVCDYVADETIAGYLELRPDAPLVALERVWHGMDSPIIYSQDYFPRAFVDGPLIPELFQGSLLAMIEKERHLQVNYAKTVIKAVQMDQDLLFKLGVENSSPWILLKQINFDIHNHPLIFSRDYYNTEKFQFRVLRKRK
jgi:GntR family transcriptional regulator